MVFMSYKDGRDYVWRAFDLIRAYTSDFSILLYLLHAYRKGFLESFRYDDHIVEYLSRELEKRRGELPDYEYQLLKVFIPALETFQYNTKGLQNIIVHFSLPGNDWYNEYETRLFDDILSTVNEWEGKSRAEFSQPYALTKFVAAISEYDGKGVMYNPFAGSATYCTEMAGEGAYLGQELSPSAWAIGVLRLLAHKMDPATFILGDSIYEWQGRSDFSYNRRTFDLIVATPPFSLRIDNKISNGFSFGEDLFIWNSLISLTPKGCAIGVFANGITLRGGKEAELRKRFVEEDKLDTVIALPAGVFHTTSIPSVVLKFSNAKSRPGLVRIIDGSSFYEKKRGRPVILFNDLLDIIKKEDEKYVRFVSVEQIREQDYIVSPRRFFEEEVSVPEGFLRKRLSDMVDIVGGQRCDSSEEKAKVVTISSLSDNPFSFELNHENLPEDTLGPQYRKITIPVLLISKVRSLKPSFIRASEIAPVYVHNHVLALKLRDNNVFLPYLVLSLSKLKDFETGSFIPHINQSTILNLSVLIPSLPVQEELYRNAGRERQESQIRELGLEEVIRSQKTEFISIIRRRKHDLNNMLGDVRNSFSAISTYLHNKGYDAEVLDEDSNISIAQLFEHLESSMSSISKVIRHLDDEEVYAEPEIIDLLPRLRAIAKEAHQNYTIRYSEDGYALCDVVQDDEEYHAYVKFGSVNLDRVFFNIIQNAEKHGFTDPTRTDYMIEIEVSHDYDSACFVIRFKNNGKPLPAGMTTRRYGTKAESAGVTAGNGDGGAIVKSTVEHYGGTVELINQPDDVFPVCVELKIPHCDE